MLVPGVGIDGIWAWVRTDDSEMRDGENGPRCSNRSGESRARAMGKKFNLLIKGGL